MKIKHLPRLFFIISLLPVKTAFCETDQDGYITDIVSKYTFLEDWKSPGRYSQYNAFDNNTNTCVTTDQDYIEFEVRFNKEVLIDEVKIINGICINRDLFIKNNRFRSLSIEYKPQPMEKGKYYEDSRRSLMLKDQMDLQSIMFEKAIKTDFVMLNAFRRDGVYEGLKYNDTCLTEIAFYYKGRKIEVRDLDEHRNHYLKKLNKALLGVLKGGEFYYTHGGGTVMFLKSGSVKNNTDNARDDNKIYPAYNAWKVDNGKVYLQINNKWKLYAYTMRYVTEPETKVMEIEIYDNDNKQESVSYYVDPESGEH